MAGKCFLEKVSDDSLFCVFPRRLPKMAGKIIFGNDCIYRAGQKA